jgi:hypothetical protein
MLAPMFLNSLVVSPAVAIAAIGVLGVFGSRYQRRSSGSGMRVAASTRNSIPLLTATPEAFGRTSDPRAFETRDGPDAQANAMQWLDSWSARPRSAWRTMGTRALQVTRAEACALTASQLILEGVVAHHVSAIDAWMMRDAADTAWYVAPEHGQPLSQAIELAARRAVTNAALAVLARAWLPAEDFERLMARAAL